MYYTYVLLSKADNKYYIGFYNKLRQRLREHHEGRVVTTKLRRPLKLVYYEACLNKERALVRERNFKTGYGRRYLKTRI